MSPRSINRPISSGVIVLYSLWLLKAVVCFIIGCFFLSFLDSHESGFISCGVYTRCITPVDPTAALFGSFNQAANWRLPNSFNEYCECIYALINECTVYAGALLEREEAEMYTRCSLYCLTVPPFSYKDQCIVNKSLCDHRHSIFGSDGSKVHLYLL